MDLVREIKDRSRYLADYSKLRTDLGSKIILKTLLHYKKRLSQSIRFRVMNSKIGTKLNIETKATLKVRPRMNSNQSNLMAK